jgi:hypothetical protein
MVGPGIVSLNVQAGNSIGGFFGPLPRVIGSL